MRIKLVLLPMLAAIATALVAPASSVGAGCPPGQTGTPPYCVTPFITVKVVKATKTTITLKLTANVPGTVKVTGSGVKTKSTRICASACTVQLKLSLTAAAKKQLKEKGKIKIKLTVTYTPDGGTAIVKKITVTIKSKK